MSRPRLELRPGLLDCDAERRYRVNALAALQAEPASTRSFLADLVGLVVVLGVAYLVLVVCG